MRTSSVSSSLAALSTSAEVGAPPAVRALAVRNIADVIGCGLAAVGLDAGSHATVLAAQAGGSEDATVLGGDRAPVAAAALANGTRFHALDFDDTHEAGICHATAVIAPAALCLGEWLGASGAEVIDAYIVGCEGATRIAAFVAPDLYAAGFHPTSVCGAFGAAMTSAHLRRLTAEQTIAALGIVGSFASGLFEYLSDGSATKPLHAGWAAQAGVQAVALAAVGASGPASVIEGRFGLLNSHGGSSVGAEQIVAELGERWEMANIAIKPYPACHFAHAATWGVGQVVESLALNAEDIEEIYVEVGAEGLPLVLDPIEEKRRPSTPYDAKFSIPFMVAHQILHGPPGLMAFTKDLIEDQAVLDLAKRVDGGPWRHGTPPSRFAASVEVKTRDGAKHALVVPHSPGSPQNPLSAEQLREKFQANAALALDAEAVNDLYAGIVSLDGEADLKSAGIARALSKARPRAEGAGSDAKESVLR